MVMSHDDKLDELELLGLREDGELEASLNALVEAGGSGSGEISLCGKHFEARYGEAHPLHEAIWKAEADAVPGTLPVVVQRYERGEWIVSMKLVDFQKLCEPYLRECAEGHSGSLIREQ